MSTRANRVRTTRVKREKKKYSKNQGPRKLNTIILTSFVWRVVTVLFASGVALFAVSLFVFDRIEDRTIKSLENVMKAQFDVIESKIQKIAESHSWQLVSVISLLKRIYDSNPPKTEQWGEALVEFQEIIAPQFKQFFLKDFETYHLFLISSSDGTIFASTFDPKSRIPLIAYGSFWSKLSEYSRSGMPLIDHSLGESLFGVPAVFVYTALDESTILGLAFPLNPEIFEREYEVFRLVSPFVEKVSITLDGEPVSKRFTKPEEFRVPLFSYRRFYKRYVTFEFDAVRDRVSTRFQVHTLLNFYTVFIIIETIVLLAVIITVATLNFVLKTSRKVSSEMGKVESAIREFGDRGFLYLTPHDSDILEVDEILKTFSTLSEIVAANLQQLTATNQELEASYRNIQKLHGELRDVFFDFTFKLAMIVEGFEENTGEHLRRVKFIVERVAEQLVEDEELRNEIVQYSLLHDIGKIFIPHEILTKPGSLTPDEWELMKRHTILAEKVLDHPRFRVALNIAKYHHENYDGTGYPEGLAGETIPLEARIVKIADVFDALTSNRPYKKAFTKEEALRIIFEGDGRVMPSHFDPKVLEAFRRILDEL